MLYRQSQAVAIQLWDQLESDRNPAVSQPELRASLGRLLRLRLVV